MVKMICKMYFERVKLDQITLNFTRVSSGMFQKRMTKCMGTKKNLNSPEKN